ncbi:MAG: ABC transporter permease [Syntrophobacteraceae bacterium]|jgi:putative ABC transport system permease protein|nr:ABC transporter permease [Syntrophobacteraceae bacterium]MCU0588895.1 ABC transporter permease [Syntrophobacteraceae bacterium]
MYLVALKMLMGDRGKYLGLIMGLTFAALLITQQSSIFTGLMTRTFSFIDDLSQPDIWVMDPKVQFIDDVKPLQDTELLRVRGVTGVEWAVPLYKGLLKARLEDGNFQIVNVLGLDDATLIGGPPTMIQGRLSDLRGQDSIIVNDVGAETRLAKRPREPGGKPVPLQVGDVLEINDRRAVVVGICRVSRTFQSQPVIYTTYNRAMTFAPRERKLLSFILVKAADGSDVGELARKIAQSTGLAAYTAEEFKKLSFDFYMKNTGIPINFGIAVMLGFFIGTAIAGQTFYNFTLENLRYFGTLKAMGTTNAVLLRMIVLQALVVGVQGFGLGIGGAALFGYLMRGTQLAFRLIPEILILAGAAITVIVIFSALISIRKVMKLEPAIVFKL